MTRILLLPALAAVIAVSTLGAPRSSGDAKAAAGGAPAIFDSARNAAAISLSGAYGLFWGASTDQSAPGAALEALWAQVAAPRHVSSTSASKPRSVRSDEPGRTTSHGLEQVLMSGSDLGQSVLNGQPGSLRRSAERPVAAPRRSTSASAPPSAGHDGGLALAKPGPPR